MQVLMLALVDFRTALYIKLPKSVMDVVSNIKPPEQYNRLNVKKYSEALQKRINKNR